MMRRADWERRMLAAVAATGPFVWGDADCCRFASRVVQAMTDEDPARIHAGEGIDAIGAQTLVDAAGGMFALLSRALGPSIEVNRASRGDVMLLSLIGGRETAGICLGDRVACQGSDGVVYLPRGRARAAWRI